MSKLPPPPPFYDDEDDDDLDDDGNDGVDEDDDEAMDLLAPTQDIEALSFTQDFNASSPDLLVPMQDVAVGTSGVSAPTPHKISMRVLQIFSHLRKTSWWGLSSKMLIASRRLYIH